MIIFNRSIENTVSVSVLDGTNPKYVYIPAIYYDGVNDNSVTSIDANGFSGVTNLESIIIPDSVISIGDGALSGCTSLAEIVIPESVSSIGDGAFSGSTSLATIVIPDSVTAIGNSLFAGCSNLSSVTIPSTVVSIGDNAFSGCESLSEITIPTSVTVIGSGALSGCTSLTEIVIPSSVTTIGSNVFSDSPNITNITIAPGNSAFTTDGKAFYNSTYTILQKYYATSDTSYSIPSTVVTTDNYSFQNANALTSMTIPSTITSIGEYMFTGCSGLESVSFETGCSSVGIGMFASCSNLTSVSLPSSLTSIGNYGFSQCNSLTTIDFTNIQTIGSYAFLDCSNLSNVSFGNQLTSIGSHAFDNCTSISSLSIPTSVTNIGASAFNNCSSIPMVLFNGNYPSIGENAFSGLDSQAVIYFNPEKTGWTNFATINDISTIALVYISGTFTQQQTLTANIRLVEAGIVPNGTSFSYQWYEDSSPISGETNNTLVLMYEQVSKTIHVVVSYNIGGSLTTLTSISSSTVDAYNNLPTGSVSISGSNTPSSVLTATNTVADVDGLGTFYYQWYRNTTSSNVGGSAIDDASNSTYTLSGIDANAYIYVKLYYTDNYGTPETVYSSPTVQIVGLPPSDVTATATSETTALISFTPSDNVTSYTVTSSPGGITNTGISSPITISGLTANTAYTFTVTSSYGSYTTPSSEASNSIQTYIAAPTSVVATATGATTATVTFVAPVGGSANTIAYDLSGGGSYYLSGTTFIVTRLTANTSYTFTVNATTNTNNTSTSASEITTETVNKGIFNSSLANYSTVFSHNTIYGSGSNNSSQLGDGTTTNRSTLTLMTNSTGKTPQSISCGSSHTMVLMSDGSIYGCGSNSSGQLGDGTNTTRSTLTLLTNSTGKTPVSISCGFSHTIVLMSDGSVYGCGGNLFRQLGDETGIPRKTLTLMTNSTGKTPVSIACGNSHTIVLMSDGSVYGCGYNNNSQLGDGTTTTRSTLTLMTNSTGKTPVSISCGNTYTMVLMSDGSVYGCGYNNNSQLGNGTTTTSSTLTLMTNSTGKTPVSISCGDSHTMVLMSDRSVYGCGLNSLGQLGSGTTTTSSTLTLMTNSTGKTPVSISCGNNHTIVLMSDGSVYGCGFNGSGQLGDGTSTTRTTLTRMTVGDGITPITLPYITAPTSVFANATSDTTATVTFVAPTGDSANSITYDLSGGGSYDLSGTTYTVTGLTANTAYTFKVIATTTTASTNASATEIQTYIAAPTSVVATAISDTTATVTFDAPAGGSANSITYDLSGGGSYSLSGTTYTVTGLTASTAYTFTVIATSSTNSTNASATAIQTYIAAPTSPTSVSASVLSSTSATVSFTASMGATSYTVTSSPGGITSTGSSTSITVSGLSANTAYTFTVTATNTTGTSESSSASSSINTYNDTPTSVSASNYGDRTSDITFSTTSYANSYIVHSYVDGSNTIYSSTYGSTSPITVSELMTDTFYNFKVASVDGESYTSDLSIVSNTVNIYSSSGLTISTNNVTGFTGTQANVLIPNSVTSIDASAFADKINIKNIYIGSGITTIGANAFAGLYGLGLTINYASIADLQYLGYTGITNVTLGSNVTSIGTNAFNSCSGITSLTIGSGVTSIAVNSSNHAFINCTSISTFIIDSSNPNYSTDGYSLYNKNSTVFYNFITNTITSYVIPNTVTTIGQHAFYNCSTLSQITLPNTITSMGQYTFYGCTSLTQITLPNTITTINANTFYGCNNLTSVSMGTSVVTIGPRVFQNCRLLPNIEISNSVTYIDHNAFNGCSVLTSLIIPNSVTYIGDTIFRNCIKLTSLIMGTGITIIKSNTVNGCNILTTLTIPVGVTSIATNAVTVNSNLETIIFNGNYPTSINASNSFASNHPSCIGYYYPNKTGWSGVAITGLTITSLLAITGTKTNGETLTATQYLSTIGATGLTYQWYSNASNSNSGGSAISAATSSTYVYDSTYAYVYVTVSYTLDGTSRSLTSNPF